MFIELRSSLPVIPATQEMESKRIVVEVSAGDITPSVMECACHPS
jgi:hypothetical protein